MFLQSVHVVSKAHVNKELLMVYYHYQCSGCYCTLSRDYLPEGESYQYSLGGLCSDCESKKEEEDFYYYDDDD